MKTALSILAAIAMTASAFGQTQTFHQVTVFGANVYLGDNLTTPLRDRVPSGAVLSGVSNQEPVTATTSVSGSNLMLKVHNWSSVTGTQKIDTGTSAIVMDDGASISVNASAKGGVYMLTGNGAGAATINSSTRGIAFGTLYNSGTLTMNAQGQTFMGYSDNAAITLSSGAIGSGAFGNFFGPVTSGISSDGTRQSGSVGVSGYMTIGNGSDGASQWGLAGGQMAIGGSAYGAYQAGYIAPNAFASNNAVAAHQIFNLAAGGESVITEGTGVGSLTVGLGTNKHEHALLISNDQSGVSKGAGTIYATGGDYSDNYGSIANASGTPAHMTDTAGLHTNYLRYTSSTITDSSDTGAPHQFTHSSINGTNYLAVFSQRSNEWYFIRMQTSTELGF